MNGAGESIDGVVSIVSDIAPLSQLIGERTVKSYIARVTHWLEYGLVALAPLGVVTTIVSTIRLSDFRLLRAAIGRTSESTVTVCSELLPFVQAGNKQSLDPNGELRHDVNDGDTSIVVIKDGPFSEDPPLGHSLRIRVDDQVVCYVTHTIHSWLAVRPFPKRRIAFMNGVFLILNITITWWRYINGDTVYGLVGYWIQIIGMFFCLHSIRSTAMNTEFYLKGSIYCYDNGRWLWGHPGRRVLSRFDRHIPTWKCAIVLSTLATGFVLNYLELRQLPWYISLGILGLVALSTLFRAYVTDDKLLHPQAGRGIRWSIASEPARLVLQAFTSDIFVYIQDGYYLFQDPVFNYLSAIFQSIPYGHTYHEKSVFGIDKGLLI